MGQIPGRAVRNADGSVSYTAPQANDHVATRMFWVRPDGTIYKLTLARAVTAGGTSPRSSGQALVARVNVRRRPSSRIVSRPSSSAASVGSMVPVASVTSRP